MAAALARHENTERFSFLFPLSGPIDMILFSHHWNPNESDNKITNKYI